MTFPYLYPMIAIGETLVSEELLEKKFVCDLNACKGACCVQGESGAPLEDKEVEILEAIYEKVKPYIPADGIKAIEKQGTHVIDTDRERVTPLVKGKHCAYTYFENGMALCAIEKAWKDGKVEFRKPISCHLYPVRVDNTKMYDAVKYERWSICKPACKLGESLQVPVYRFVKDALVRKYGKKWYAELEQVAKLRETAH
jgi:hypothetical protein